MGQAERNLLLQGFLEFGNKYCKLEVTFATHHYYAISIENRLNRSKKSEIIEIILGKIDICGIIKNNILCGGKDDESKLQKAPEITC